MRFQERKNVSSAKISIPSHFQKPSPKSEKHLLLGNSLFPPLLAQDYLDTPKTAQKNKVKLCQNTSC